MPVQRPNLGRTPNARWGRSGATAWVGCSSPASGTPSRCRASTPPTTTRRGRPRRSGWSRRWRGATAFGRLARSSVVVASVAWPTSMSGEPRDTRAAELAQRRGRPRGQRPSSSVGFLPWRSRWSRLGPGQARGRARTAASCRQGSGPWRAGRPTTRSRRTRTTSAGGRAPSPPTPPSRDDVNKPRSRISRSGCGGSMSYQPAWRRFAQGRVRCDDQEPAT